MPMRPRCGTVLAARQRKSCDKLLLVRLLERVHLAALRIEAAHHMLDDAVLAGRVHRLKHDQNRPVVSRIKSLLQILETLDAFLEKILRMVLREAERFVRIGVGDTELVGLVDPKAFGDVGEIHEAEPSRRSRPQRAQEHGGKIGNSGIDILAAAQHPDVGELRQSFAAQMGERLGAQRLGIMPRAQHLHRDNARRAARRCASPARR